MDDLSALGIAEAEPVGSPVLEKIQSVTEKLDTITSAEREVTNSLLGDLQSRLDVNRERAIAVTNAEERFRRVTLDGSLKREARYGNKVVKVPLIFRAPLPAPFQVMEKSDCGACKVTAKTPSPPAAAMSAYTASRALFDSCEVWWVPNDVLVTRIPDPDPILVGVFKTGNLPVPGPLYYELYRWVDEAVEDGWWTGEAY